MNIEEIMSLLPHRFPMLMVDRILEIVPGKKCVALKNVTVNEAFFTGHFPGNPCMPGVLILESMAQSAAVIVLRESKFAGMFPFLLALDKARFRKPVVPGDQLISTAETVWFRRNVGRAKSTATVNGEVVAEVEFTFMLVPRCDSQSDASPETIT